MKKDGKIDGKMKKNEERWKDGKMERWKDGKIEMYGWEIRPS